ncbi:MAG: hypothetical protein L0I76_30365, partial [Pseudonocardia sp.]|nr:hypothetical protein [Pseudonocardia sp.]
MSTHTDGAPPSVGAGPSVRSAGAEEDPPSGTAGVPPRPRRPSPSPVSADKDEDDGATPAPRGASPPPSAGSPAASEGPAASGNPAASGIGAPRGSRRAADPADGPGGSSPGWLQQEIARRVAERKGVTDTGRHARPDTVAGVPSAPPDGHARPGPAPGSDPSAAGVAPAADEEDEDGDGEDTPAPRIAPERARTFRTRSGRVPDTYAPGGMREPRAGDGWPSA